MYSYFAQFIQQEDKGYCVYFPDIDVATEGDTMEDAIAMAQDALRTHIEICLEEKDFIAKPSDYLTVKIKSEKYCKELNIKIPADTFYQFVQTEITEKPQRINVSFAPKVLKSIDKAASSYGLSRSAFLTVAAQDYINRA